jgi:hypothetical protein
MSNNKHYTIKRNCLRTITECKQADGEYGYSTGTIVHEITHGPCAGQHLVEHYGFRWHGSTGGMYTSWTLATPESTGQLIQCCTDGQVLAAAEAALALCDQGDPAIHVQD